MHAGSWSAVLEDEDELVDDELLPPLDVALTATVAKPLGISVMSEGKETEETVDMLS